MENRLELVKYFRALQIDFLYGRGNDSRTKKKRGKKQPGEGTARMEK